MRYDTAIAMSLLRHICVCIKDKTRFSSILTTQQADEFYRSIKPYLNHENGLSLSTIRYLTNKYSYLQLPYDYNKYDIGNNAIAYHNKLYLFYVCKNMTDVNTTGMQTKYVTGLATETYKWNRETITYTYCDNTFENVAYLRVAGWEVLSNIKNVDKIVDIDKSCLDPRLFPYQVEGIRMLASGYRLMADEQGLGKTAQVLQYIQYEGFRRILIICPATLKLNWRREILMWTKTNDSKIEIISGTRPYSVQAKYVIINYDLLHYWQTELANMEFDIICCDECHYIQSSKAQRTQAFINVSKHVEDKIFISGTPFTSKPFQMYTALHNIAPRIFRTQNEYGMRFCRPVYIHNQLTFNGACNTDLLHNILTDGICIRRLKQDVLKDLPDKMRVTVPIGLTPEEVRTSAVATSIRDLERKISQAKDVLSTLEYQRQIAYLRKRDDINKWIADFLESDKKLVVFGVHKATLDAIEHAFANISVRIDGSTPNNKRDEYVQRFQKDPSIKLFIGNVQAAGTGITLTAASDAVVVEFPYSSALLLQAEDRIHRIGAKNACMIYYMAVPGTIDDRMISIVNAKAKMHSNIFDDTNDNMLEVIRKEGGSTYTPIF